MKDIKVKRPGESWPFGDGFYGDLLRAQRAVTDSISRDGLFSQKAWESMNEVLREGRRGDR